MSKNSNRIKAYIVCTVFIAILVVPSILFPFVKEHIDTENRENRNLAERPEFVLSQIFNFPKNYEDFFNDHLPFKNQFVKLSSTIDLVVFKKLTSDLVLLGKNYWLFYKSPSDGDPIACYQGTNLLTEDELKAYADTLVTTSNELKAQGKEFVLMLAPNKEQVYSEYMPESISVVSDFSRCDQLYEYLTENTDIKVVYPFAEMLKHKNEYQLYYKYDTHWNELGAFIGEQQLLNSLGYDRLYLEDITYTYEGVALSDLSNMANITSVLPEQKDIVISDYKPDVDTTLLETADNGYYHKYVSNASDAKKAFIIGDSFRSAMMHHFPQNFSETIFFHYNNTNSELFKPLDSDIVVLEVVERYLNAIPTHCNSLMENIKSNTSN